MVDQAMPRGGPDASWLDRRLQTTVLEYTDRSDVPDHVKQTVISALVFTRPGGAAATAGGTELTGVSRS